MKSLLKKIFANLGFRLVKLENTADGAKRDFTDAYEVQKYLTQKPSSEVVIFDLGAFDGRTAVKYKGDFPESTIYSFEPFPSSFQDLVKNTSAFKDVHPVNKGVSDEEGVFNFNSNDNAQTNSLLSTDDKSDDVWGKGVLKTNKTIEVDVTTIDSFVASEGIENIDILKMDVQGAEFKVLKGAKNTLEKGIVKLVYTEILTMPTYEDQVTFEELISFMKSSGFMLYNFYNASLTKEGQLRQVDGIFVKSQQPS